MTRTSFYFRVLGSLRAPDQRVDTPTSPSLRDVDSECFSGWDAANLHVSGARWKLHCGGEAAKSDGS